MHVAIWWVAVGVAVFGFTVTCYYALPLLASLGAVALANELLIGATAGFILGLPGIITLVVLAIRGGALSKMQRRLGGALAVAGFALYLAAHLAYFLRPASA